MLKYSIPMVSGRGAGLGNELIPWARAYISGVVLGARYLTPAFGLNQRKYWRHFGTCRLDWLCHGALANMLPRVEFTETDFYDFGGGPLSAAIEQFAAHHQLHERGAWVLVTRGLWGGYRHVVEAKQFVRAKLELSRFAAKNLLAIRSRLNSSLITVGMHVRLGDFKSPDEVGSYRGAFNAALPLEWYINIVKALRSALGDAVQFLIVSDGSKEQLAPLLALEGTVSTADILDSDVSDMLALADSDLLVCSVSSYSAWAAFLSNSPYIWFEPNLQKIDGYYSIWGHEKRQREVGGFTRMSRESFESQQLSTASARGCPVSLDGKIDAAFIDNILITKKRFSIDSDLVFYGVVPTSETINSRSFAMKVGARP